jgi:N-acetyl-gamma-glutamyl-phosphate reductase
MSHDTDQRIDVALVGATGYAGQELVRILARHPRVRLTAALGSATMEAPRKLPALARIWDGEVLPYSADRIGPSVRAAFLALPEANAAETAPELLARGIRVIDLSGAFRLRDDAARAKYYPKTAALPAGTVYGLAELDGSSIADAKLISCPGCYPTAALIGLGPLEAAGLLEGDVVVDAARIFPRTTAAWRPTASSRTGTRRRSSRRWAAGPSRSSRISSRSTAGSSRRSTRA